MATDWTFRVRLSDVALRSVAATADRPANSAPYYRCDFDGKVMQSELCNAPGDATWTHKATFDYRLDEDTLQEAVASLASRHAVFEACFTDGTEHVVIGSASVDLFTLATGSSKLQLPVRRAATGVPNATSPSVQGGDVVAMLHATLMMEHLAVIETSIASLSLNSLPEPTQVQLEYNVLEDTGATPVESQISPATRDPLFERGPLVLTRTSLRVYVNNTVRIRFYDMAGGARQLMGAVDVPIKEMITSACDQSCVVKRNMYADPAYRRSFTGHVAATIMVRNLPSFAQLATGTNANGHVHGKPLLEGLMLPANYSKFPARLPDYQPPPQPVVTPLVHVPPASDVSGTLPPSGLPISEAKLGDRHPPGFTFAMPAAPSPRRALNASPLPQARAVSPPRPRSPNPPVITVPPSVSSTQAPSGVTPMAGSGSAAAYSIRRTDGARSPVAGAGSQLKQQHDEALHAIEEQRRRVAQLADDLRMRTETEQQQERRRLDALESEDRTLHSRFEAATRNMEELRRLLDETDASAQNDVRECAAERAEAEQELADLDAAEREMQAFITSVQAHAEENERKREVARVQAQEAQAVLNNDMHALADFESRVAARNRARSSGASPYRVARSPRMSPTQSPNHSSSAVNMSTSAAGTGSGGQATVGELLDAITTGNDAAFHRALSMTPELLQMEHSWLLRACNAPFPNDAIVSTILRRRPELVHMVDPTSSNTPLHAACSAQRPNSGVVSLLLQHGANAYALNTNGITPMHVALMNVNDVDDAVKRALIAKAGVAILDQPSSSGETGAHLAAVNDRYLPSLRFLADNGANMQAVAIFLRDGRGLPGTPRDRAVWAGRDADGCRRFLEGMR